MEQLEVDSDKGQLDRVMDFVRGCLRGLGVSEAPMMQLELAVEEIFVNIADYAYRGAGKVWIGCDVERDTMSVSITFKDRGEEFDPLDQPDPDTTASALDRPIGGLGIFLVKRNVDGISYRRRDGYNILTIEKRLS